MDLVVPIDQRQCASLLSICRSMSDKQEYFAEVDEDYIFDRFNLTGLNSDVVAEYSRALDLITDSLGVSRHVGRNHTGADMLDDEALDDDVRENIEHSARFLYGLIHARYIVTSRGLAKMVSPPLPSPSDDTPQGANV